ncbi:MAG TPA: hypothetical protein VFV37_03530 [Luteibaculaceae bacterium]|nr:hypothetical protein [Luteibaculaceae bacterium]
MKSWKHIAWWVTGVLAFFAVLSFTTAKHRERKLTGPEIDIDWSNGLFFVSKEDVLNKIRTVHENLTEVSIADANPDLIEQAVMQLPEVKRAEVFINIDGKLKISVEQRVPIARIIPEAGSSFYIDEDGKYMPLSKNFAARVLVVNGKFTQRYRNISAELLQRNDTLKKQTLFDEFFELAQFIRADSLWSAQIQQVYVNENKEFELIPRVGNHNIELGNTTDLEDKFRRLFIFYSEGLPYSNWNKYSKISLKYKNQVVCTLKQLPV